MSGIVPEELPEEPHPHKHLTRDQAREINTIITKRLINFYHGLVKRSQIPPITPETKIPVLVEDETP